MTEREVSDAHDWFGPRPAQCDAWLAAHDERALRYSARNVLTNMAGVLTQIIGTALKRVDAARSIRLPPRPSPSAPPPPGGEDK